jgi:sporulation protein YlmC with PRC-barrel domain
MHLVRDVMDTQLVRRDGLRVGKVDGLVMELREGAPPRLAYIETGTGVLARRLSPRLWRWIGRLRGRLGETGGGDVVRVPWAKVCDVGVDIEVDVEETAATQLQDWLVKRIISKLPGGFR